MEATINNLRDGERERQMYCSECGAEYSADRDDYFTAPASDTVIECENGHPMKLVTKQTIHQPVV
ncbi:hypothetical protein LCGC14_1279800 [marine sediment metagenome]|uniref:Uncharacterized protein n=1 Tax=marine sediment metagenome TaxID=412755 RepID=A0A0F9LGU3_9ZZZZ